MYNRLIAIFLSLFLLISFMVGCGNHRAPHDLDTNQDLSAIPSTALSLPDMGVPTPESGTSTEDAGHSNLSGDQTTENPADDESTSQTGTFDGKTDESKKATDKNASNPNPKVNPDPLAQPEDGKGLGKNEHADTKKGEDAKVGGFKKFINVFKKKKDHSEQTIADGKLKRTQSASDVYNIDDKQAQKANKSAAVDKKVRRAQSASNINQRKADEKPDLVEATEIGSSKKKKFKLPKLGSKKEQRETQVQGNETVKEVFQDAIQQQADQQEAITVPQELDDTPIKKFKSLIGSRMSLSSSNISYQKRPLGPSKLRFSREAEDVLGSKRKKAKPAKIRSKDINQTSMPKKSDQEVTTSPSLGENGGNKSAEIRQEGQDLDAKPENLGEAGINKSEDLIPAIINEVALKKDGEQAAAVEQQDAVPANLRMKKRRSTILRKLNPSRTTVSFSELPIETEETKEAKAAKVKQVKEAEDVDLNQKVKHNFIDRIRPKKLFKKFRKEKEDMEKTRGDRQNSAMEDSNLTTPSDLDIEGDKENEKGNSKLKKEKKKKKKEKPGKHDSEHGNKKDGLEESTLQADTDVVDKQGGKKIKKNKKKTKTKEKKKAKKKDSKKNDARKAKESGDESKMKKEKKQKKAHIKTAKKDKKKKSENAENKG